MLACSMLFLALVRHIVVHMSCQIEWFPLDRLSKDYLLRYPAIAFCLCPKSPLPLTRARLSGKGFVLGIGFERRVCLGEDSISSAAHGAETTASVKTEQGTLKWARTCCDCD